MPESENKGRLMFAVGITALLTAVLIIGAFLLFFIFPRTPSSSDLPAPVSKTPEKSAAQEVTDNLTTATFPSPMEAVLEEEKAEAKKLVSAGIIFKTTKSAHGMRNERGVTFGSNDFESSDGVALNRSGKQFDSPEEAKKQFDATLQNAPKVFEKGDVKGTLGEEKRFIGVSGNQAIIVSISGHYLYTVTSPSLRHLLAFEEKEPHYFDYKSAK